MGRLTYCLETKSLDEYEKLVSMHDLPLEQWTGYVVTGYITESEIHPDGNFGFPSTESPIPKGTLLTVLEVDRHEVGYYDELTGPGAESYKICGFRAWELGDLPSIPYDKNKGQIKGAQILKQDDFIARLSGKESSLLSSGKSQLRDNSPHIQATENIMSEQTNPLSLEQAKELKLPALRMGQLSDAMLALQLMDKLCVKSLDLNYELANPHGDDNLLLPCDVTLDRDLAEQRGGVKALQSVLVNEFEVDSGFFVDGTIDELESIISDMYLYSHLDDMFDIDYHNARFGDDDRTSLNREHYRKIIDETVAELLPQLKETVNRIA